MHSTRGFSLIEVIVAVAIIGTVTVAVGTLMQRLPVNGREVRDQDIAMKIARNEIEHLRALGYVALPASGAFANTLLASLASSTASITISAFNAKTKQVDVRVSWRGTGTTTRAVSLSTLITENSSLK